MECCFCTSTSELTNVLSCEHKLCASCVRSTAGNVKCPVCCDPSTSHKPTLTSSQSYTYGFTPPGGTSLDDELAAVFQEVPQIKRQLADLIVTYRRGQRGAGQIVAGARKKIDQSAAMAVKNINHRAQKLIEQVQEIEEKRKHGIVSLLDDTTDNKGALQMICLLARALAEDDSDDFATVALGEELVQALTLVQAHTLLLEFDDDISGLGVEFAEKPQDASVGTLVRKQNCVGISTLDNNEFLLAVDQRSNGGVCLGRANKNTPEDVRWILAFQPLDVVAPVVLSSFSATKTDREQNTFFAAGREVFSVNIDRLFSSSTVSSSTSVRNYRLTFLPQDARITAIDWYPENPDYVIIANDKSEVLHVVDIRSSTIKKEIKPQVSFKAANSLMSLKVDGKIQIAIASETSKKAAMLHGDGKVICHFKKPSEYRPEHPATACLPRALFLSTVTELFIFRQSKIGVLWVDEKRGNEPVYVLYDADDGTWRRMFTMGQKIPVGVTLIPPRELAFCYSSARVKVAGFKE
ncbi:uncharacterized protein [Apostichopus japonicus]|uniref:uncharacterized protein n=1 Tax=Stichopus japonicus TaxID=307972 RepID=UPI003AB40E4D